MDLLALDIGNTRIGWALFADGRLVQTLRTGPQESAFAAVLACFDHLDDARRAALPVVAACVNPTNLERRLQPIVWKLGKRVLLLGQDVPQVMPNRLDRPDKTGVDRLAAALGAVVTVGGPAVVVDAGTAVTVDCVDADGVFLGGAILPGLATQLWSLRQRTAQLPEIKVEAAPSVSVGVNTVEAISGGVFFGLVGAVDHLVRRAVERVGTRATVVACGGDAALLAPHCSTFDKVDELLVYHGIYEWVRRASAAGWIPTVAA